MLSFAYPSLIAFIIFLAITGLAFGLTGMVWFGKQGTAYDTIWHLLSTELNMLVGDGLSYDDFTMLHRLAGHWCFPFNAYWGWQRILHSGNAHSLLHL